MSNSVDTRPLVLFAVKEEAQFFQCRDVEKVVGGMGQANAKRVIRNILSARKPEYVITSGFAGGLNNDLQSGSVIGNWDESFPHPSRFERGGVRPVEFHCADHVAITSNEKRELRRITNCDAVEMESGVIRGICAEMEIPSATVRVISDAADEDLPLNFNELMNPDYTMNFSKLVVALVKSPLKIPKLIKFSANVKSASKELGRALSDIV